MAGQLSPPLGTTFGLRKGSLGSPDASGQAAEHQQTHSADGSRRPPTWGQLEGVGTLMGRHPQGVAQLQSRGTDSARLLL